MAKNGGFSLMDENAEAVAQNLLDNFDTIPENLKNEMLIRLSEKTGAAETMGRILLIKFELISEDVRNNVLIKLSEMEIIPIIVIVVIERHFDRMAENLRNELLVKFSNNKKFVSNVEQIASENSDKIPEDILNKISENIRNLYPFQTKYRRPILTKTKPQKAEAERPRVGTAPPGGKTETLAHPAPAPHSWWKERGKILDKSASKAKKAAKAKPKKGVTLKKAAGLKKAVKPKVRAAPLPRFKGIMDKKTKYARLGYRSGGHTPEVPIRRGEHLFMERAPQKVAREKPGIKQAQPEQEPEMQEAKEKTPGSQIKASPRYTDITFFYDEGKEQDQKVLKAHALQEERKYRLEVAVREKTTGIVFEGREQEPIGEPKHEQAVKIIVTAEPENEEVIEIKDRVQSLILPPLGEGDSTENAVFHVVPLRQSSSKGNIAQIRIRLYYEFNLIEVAKINAEIVGKFDDPARSLLGFDVPVWFEQERRVHDYAGFNSIMPRDMHIHITKSGERYKFAFLIEKSSDEKILLSASTGLPTGELEGILENIREIWHNIAMSETFSRQLRGKKDEYIANVRKLAKKGDKLWSTLFMSERGSMYAIGEWLRNHPIESGGIIQVSVEDDATSFVFPWALIYDKDLKDNESELPDIKGFWGLKYCIEQRSLISEESPMRKKITDEPVRAEKLKVGFMLWDKFSNVKKETSLMDKLNKRSAGKLEVSTPPIIEKDVCYNLLRNCDAQILYFYTHGYTMYYSKKTGFRENLEFFKKIYEGLDKDSQVHKTYKALYDNIKKNKFEDDSSWIELSYGKLYLDELYKIKSLQSNPIVILNMCESAQIIPSMGRSFITFFLISGARSVIGTECPMTVEFAHPFAEVFLEGILKGEPIGTVLLNARRHFMELKNPLGLAYTLFGSATARFEPPVLQ